MRKELTEETIISLVSQCAEAACEAAKYLPNYACHESTISMIKGPHREEVTLYDRALENEILRILVSKDNGDGYIAEENGCSYSTNGITWIVDPIDGTPNFIRQIPAYAISIAAEINGEVVAGAVYDPSHDDIFTAGLGLGAKRNRQEICPSNVKSLSDAIISTGFSKKVDVRRKQARILTKLLTEVKDLRSSGSAALELCWLAAGKLDAYYEHDLRYWDFAAGALIASEAGAIISIHDDFIIGASSLISQQLSALLIESSAFSL